MGIEKPPSIANDPFKSAKWDEVAAGRSFSQSDAPALALLCQWYAVVERCMDDVAMDGEGLPRVAYVNDMGDVKAMPQLATMFWCSDILTGSQTTRKQTIPKFLFWCSDILTGSQTWDVYSQEQRMFWCSDILTGSQTLTRCCPIRLMFWCSDILTGSQTFPGQSTFTI